MQQEEKVPEGGRGQRMQGHCGGQHQLPPGKGKAGQMEPARHGSKGNTDIRRGPSPAPEERGRLRAQHPKAGTELLGNEAKCTGLKKRTDPVFPTHPGHLTEGPHSLLHTDAPTLLCTDPPNPAQQVTTAHRSVVAWSGGWLDE